MCDVDEEAVVSAVDAPSIYDIPKVLHTEGLDAYVVRRLGLPFRDVDWSDWDDLLRRVHRPGPQRHDRAGRQVRRPARRLPVARRGAAGRRVRQRRPGEHPVGDQRRLPDTRGRGPPARGRGRGARPGRLRGPGYRGEARRHPVRPQNGIPLLGLCLGLQCAAIEVARDVAGLPGANSSEFDPDTPDPVIATMADQQDVVAGERDMGGTDAAGPVPGRARPRVPWCASCTGRTWWKSGTGTATRSTTPTARSPGTGRADQCSGLSPDGRLVEFVELSREVHPFFVATQAHPEFLSRPTRAHPLFAGLVAAARERAKSLSRGGAALGHPAAASA